MWFLNSFEDCSLVLCLKLLILKCFNKDISFLQFTFFTLLLLVKILITLFDYILQFLLTWLTLSLSHCPMNTGLQFVPWFNVQWGHTLLIIQGMLKMKISIFYLNLILMIYLWWSESQCEGVWCRMLSPLLDWWSTWCYWWLRWGETSGCCWWVDNHRWTGTLWNWCCPLFLLVSLVNPEDGRL